MFLLLPFYGLLLVCQSIGYSHCIWKHKCQMFPIVCRLSLINTFSEGSNNNTLHIGVYKIQSLWHAIGCIRNNFKCFKFVLHISCQFVPLEALGFFQLVFEAIYAHWHVLLFLLHSSSFPELELYFTKPYSPKS